MKNTKIKGLAGAILDYNTFNVAGKKIRGFQPSKLWDGFAVTEAKPNVSFVQKFLSFVKRIAF